MTTYYTCLHLSFTPNMFQDVSFSFFVVPRIADLKRVEVLNDFVMAQLLSHLQRRLLPVFLFLRKQTTFIYFSHGKKTYFFLLETLLHNKFFMWREHVSEASLDISSPCLWSISLPLKRSLFMSGIQTIREMRPGFAPLSTIFFKVSTFPAKITWWMASIARSNCCCQATHM